MIEFSHVCKSYAQPVLHDVCFSIADGELVTVIGGSGSGKSTLLKMVNGLVTPDSGNISIAGRDVRKCNLLQLRRSIGYVVQSTGLFPHMCVRDNILYVCKLLKMGQDEMQERLANVLDTVQLEADILNRYSDELSGGQAQRVGLARALIARPRLLLMDEPFASVDELTRKALQDEIRRIHQQSYTTVLFITHDVHEAMSLGDRCMIINDGHIEQLATAEAIHAAPATDYVRELIGMA
jgi:osmoprotectant transport system ATP-binding protein